MAFAEWLGLVLLVANIFQWVWWSRQVQALIDKLMSRNYAEYVASKEYRNPQSLRPTLEDAKEIQAQEDQVLNELNQHFGIKGG